MCKATFTTKLSDPIMVISVTRYTAEAPGVVLADELISLFHCLFTFHAQLRSLLLQKSSFSVAVVFQYLRRKSLKRSTDLLVIHLQASFEAATMADYR